MDKNDAQELIASHFPDLDIDTLVKIGEGTGNVAYELNNDLIFRFPKSLDDQRRLETEISIQPLLQKYSSLPFQVFIFVPQNHSFCGYKKLVGESMLTKWQDYSQWDIFSERLGTFLTNLHKVPSDELKGLPIPVEKKSVEDYRKLGCTFYEKTKGVIPGHFHQGIESFFNSKPPADVNSVVLCHNDLGIEHILISRNAITGVIDWGGTALTDPACDFARIYRDLGEKVLENVLMSYHAVDVNKDSLRERAMYYGKCLYFEDLFYATRKKDYLNKSMQVLEWMF